MRHKLRGKMWEVEYNRLPVDVRGTCDSPETHGKRIRIAKRLKGQERLEVLLHEGLHACLWDLDETAIEEMAHDLARMLWREFFKEKRDG